jgi:thioredoxin 1
MTATKNTSSFFLLIILLLAASCGQRSSTSAKVNITSDTTIVNQSVEKTKRITFIELGSVRCIPCQQMQAVMKSIETKYGNEVKIVFHDVWTEAGKPYGVKYGIEAIPTQVFLDETGKEYFRHVGYFPEEELVQILQIKGIKLK